MAVFRAWLFFQTPALTWRLPLPACRIACVWQGAHRARTSRQSLCRSQQDSAAAADAPKATSPLVQKLFYGGRGKAPAAHQELQSRGAAEDAGRGAAAQLVALEAEMRALQGDRAKAARLRAQLEQQAARLEQERAAFDRLKVGVRQRCCCCIAPVRRAPVCSLGLGFKPQTLKKGTVCSHGPAPATALLGARRCRFCAQADELAAWEARKEEEERRLKRDRRVLEKQGRALLKLPSRKERSEVAHCSSSPPPGPNLSAKSGQHDTDVPHQQRLHPVLLLALVSGDHCQ
jgi:hypothetical protein